MYIEVVSPNNPQALLDFDIVEQPVGNREIHLTAF
jgi:hypothetical protein